MNEFIWDPNVMQERLMNGTFDPLALPSEAQLRAQREANKIVVMNYTKASPNHPALKDLVQTVFDSSVRQIQIFGMSKGEASDDLTDVCVSLLAPEQRRVDLISGQVPWRMGSAIAGWKLPDLLARHLLAPDNKLLRGVARILGDVQLAREGALAPQLENKDDGAEPLLSPDMSMGLYKTLDHTGHAFDLYLIIGSPRGCLSKAPLSSSRSLNREERYVSPEMVADLTLSRRLLQENLEEVARVVILRLGKLLASHSHHLDEFWEGLAEFCTYAGTCHVTLPDDIEETEDDVAIAAVGSGLAPTVYAEYDMVEPSRLGVNVTNMTYGTQNHQLLIRESQLGGLHLLTRLHARDLSTPTVLVHPSIMTSVNDLNEVFETAEISVLRAPDGEHVNVTLFPLPKEQVPSMEWHLSHLVPLVYLPPAFTF